MGYEMILLIIVVVVVILAIVGGVFLVKGVSDFFGGIFGGIGGVFDIFGGLGKGVGDFFKGWGDAFKPLFEGLAGLTKVVPPEEAIELAHTQSPYFAPAEVGTPSVSSIISQEIPEGAEIDKATAEYFFIRSHTPEIWLRAPVMPIAPWQMANYCKMSFGSKKGDPNYKTECDMNQDGVIDIYDFALFVKYA